jgi:hypothetical protein
MQTTLTFKAVFEKGRLRPVGACPALHEREPVWVTLQRDPRSLLVRTGIRDPLLQRIRRRLRDLPALDLTSAISEGRDRF